MKICIPASGSSVDSLVDDRFGRAPFFALIEESIEKAQIINNPHAQGAGGIGPRVTKLIADNGVTHLLAAQVGGNADESLRAAGIVHITCKSGISIWEAYNNWKSEVTNSS